MPIEAGQQLLHYRLIEKIGEGGMGVVWKAEDTALHREVAIKVLPAAVSRDQERLARFDREAKLLASLNHANIASVYGLHEDDGVRFLAMEYVQGDEVSSRLARGPLSVDEALGIARQIADALQSAHENGVIHRDLKPANILITPAGQAKVLDFGLAKAFEADPSAPVNPTLSPTLTSAGTVAGVILGTAGYMSPEQARGEPVDKRADIWAFGCVLFEMLTGRMLFKEQTISDTLASVLKVEPDWGLLPADVPESIHRLLKRCLQKDVRQRLHDVADARIEMEETLSTPPDKRAAAPGSGSRRRVPIGMTILLVAAGLAIGLLVGPRFGPAKPEQRLRRFFLPVDAEEGRQSVTAPVVSPDGRTIVYVFDDKLWLRDLEQVAPRPLDATEGGDMPFWSPDGAHVGYRKDDSLWRIPVGGGQAASICGEAPEFYPASWGDDGMIVFSRVEEIREVPARGGEPKTILRKDAKTEQHFHDTHRLPGGRGLLLVSHRDDDPDTITLWDGGKRRNLMTLEGSEITTPTYSSTGHILFTRGVNNEGLWAIPFSLASLEVTGEPFLVVPQGTDGSASSDGTLVYMDSRPDRDMELVWFDASGAILGTIGQPQTDMDLPVISPDGTKVAVSGREDEDWDIWVHDDTGGKVRVTFDKGHENEPRWSFDGRRIFYNHPDGPDASIYSVDLDAGGGRELLTEGRQVSLSRDESHIVFSRADDDSEGDLWSMSLEGDGAATVFLQTEADESMPALSPDGHFVAYISEESATPHVYVKAFPEQSGEWQVSDEHGWRVLWSPAGDRLYYHYYGSLMEVEVRTDPTLRLGTPRRLIEPDETEALLWKGIDIAKDGKRFVGIRNVEPDDEDRDGVEEGIHVVLNWYSDFRE